MSPNATSRIGLVIPSVNVVIERDIRRFLPDEVEAHVTRIPLVANSAEALRVALDAAPTAARLLADAGVSAMALACTGASMIPSGDEPTAAQRLTAETHLPAIDTFGALLAAFRALNVQRIMLVSPFDDASNVVEANVFEAAGIEVVGMTGFAISDPRHCPTVDPATIVERSVKSEVSEADAVFLSCANLRGFEAVAELEQRLGKPVVTSNQAVLWALLHLSGNKVVSAGRGRLFHHQPEISS